MSEQPMAYEEVPGTRTLQQAVEQPQRPRWAWEELQPGDLIQDKDEWQNEDGRWHPLVLTPGASTQVRDVLRARRPHNITALQKERDEARAQGAKLSAELWARKPLEDRVASLTEELTQAREASQQLLQTIADNADQFADHTTALVRQRDGFDAEVQRLQEVVRNLYNEPTARQVQQMLRTWATELDWSVGCFGSFGRSQIDIIQQTMVAVIQRIEGLVNPEGGVDGE